MNRAKPPGAQCEKKKKEEHLQDKDQIGTMQNITAQTGGTVNVFLLNSSKVEDQVNANFGTACTHKGAETTFKSPAASFTPAAQAGDIVTADDVQNAVTEYKRSLEERYECIFEGMAKESETLLESIYTELYIVEGERKLMEDEHEIWNTEQKYSTQLLCDHTISCNDIFKSKPVPGKEKKERRIRTVLTKGIAGIGKTVSVQKFIVDWAKGKDNCDTGLIFLLPFRELNLIKDETFSLCSLLSYLCPELKSVTEECIKKPKLVFIFDGLDECQIKLTFPCRILSEVTEESRMDQLLVNLIQGKLLPKANVWITSRPAAAYQIPPEYINRVTEIQGFNDAQKEMYFRKKISDQDLASKVISHIKKSGTLYSICYIPVFCQISATVLQTMFDQNKSEIPKTLTEMYTNLLLIHTDIKQQKFEGSTEKDYKKLLQSNRAMILKLSELAFKQLMKGNVMFYEDQLRECDIDVTMGSLFCGVCTEIFKIESGLCQRKIYCFVHLSLQEFLAAFFVFHSFVNKDMEVLQVFTSWDKKQPTNVRLLEILEGAVDKALESQNGHLDLFVRFLLGISLDSNQKLLHGLLTQTHSSSETINNITCYIKQKIKGEDEDWMANIQTQNLSTERSINLFLCLNEIKDLSLSKEIKNYIKIGKRSEVKLSAAHCSAIAYMLLMSDEVLDKLDMKKFNTSREGYRRLIPAVRNCRKALLANCNLGEQTCESLGSILQLADSSLRELDLSNNDLQDTGVKLISAALKCSHCKLEILRLAICNLGEQTCGNLGTVLQSANSFLRELDLSDNDLQDSGVKLLSDGLKSSHCKLKILRLAMCNLGEQTCDHLRSVLQPADSPLRELDLSNNDLKDLGVKLISDGLKSSHCKLEILGLSGCLVTEEGCSHLASALSSNPSHLKELNLTYNNPGDSGVKLLTARLENPHCRLEILRLEHAGSKWIKPGLRKYACKLTLDPNTAHTRLSLSQGNTKVKRVREQRVYPDHPERFNMWEQVMCRESLTGRCYWEAEWTHKADIAVTNKGINRKGRSNDCIFGRNRNSWRLSCSGNSYSVCYNKNETVIPEPPFSSNRVGVYLDCPAGTLTFYSVSSDTQSLTHLHTFHSTFIEPLYAGFWVYGSVCVCKIE